jgi:hypothetical protein
MKRTQALEIKLFEALQELKQFLNETSDGGAKAFAAIDTEDLINLTYAQKHAAFMAEVLANACAATSKLPQFTGRNVQ